MKKTLRILMISILVLSMSTLVSAMGAKPELPTDIEIPAEYNELAGDMTTFALSTLKETVGNEIDIQSLLGGFLDDGYIELGEFNGIEVSIKPSLSDIMGLTIQLEFEDADVEVPSDITNPTGEQKAVGTISSGTMDITIGVELASILKTMIVVQIDTPDEEPLVVEIDGNENTIVFDEFKFGYNISKLAPISGEDYTITGKIIVNDVEVDIEEIIDLIELLTKGL